MDDLCPLTSIDQCHVPMIRKRKIIQHFEIPIAGLYPRENVKGMFLTEPLRRKGRERRPWNPWMSNEKYWKRMVSNQGFPAMKVKMAGMSGRRFKKKLVQCTTKMDQDFMLSLNFTSILRPIGESAFF
jgi:hypothetical protein